MWRIERAEFQRGGRVRFGEDLRLKHLSSGFYLCVYKPDQLDKINEEGEESGSDEEQDGLMMRKPEGLPKP